MALALPVTAAACHSGGVRPRSAELFALDARTGRQQWRVRLSDLDVTPPVADSGAVYISGPDRTAGYDGPTGRVRWRSDYVSRNSPFGTHVVGTTLIASDGHSIATLDTRTGNELSRNQDTDYDCSAGADWPGVHARGADGQVHALDLRSGHPRWEATAEPGFCAPALAAGGA